MRHSRERRAVVGAALLAAAALPAHAQVPDTFTNLQVLPKTISKKNLVETMRGFCFALAVRCDHCHLRRQNPPPNLDFASDEKPEKAKARLMLAMVSAINDEHLAKLKERQVKVECVTCHHGLSVPRTMKSVLTESVAEKGIEATVARYRELRKEYLDTGAYDFSDTPLNRVAEELMGEKPTEATVLLELSAELHPDSTWTHTLRAEAYRTSGDLEKAKGAYEKVLALDPKDKEARRRLDELKAAAKP
jgi:tetratricopeptide (TPR) repeat protein